MKVLICHEKHFNRYFVIPDNETLHRTCVKILKERLKEGWYEPNKLSDVVDRLGMTEKSINSMPEGEIKKRALDMFSSYKEREKIYQKEKLFLEKVKEVIGTPFNPAKKMSAFYILSGRRDYEYERVDLEDAEEI